MATSELRGVIDYLKKVAQKQEAARSDDGKLLEAFIRSREEIAFQTIMRRHGPMVMGVCRRVLHNRHDAEDAFQATFLVLARKAASISSRKLLANWLYGVAFKTALKAHAAKAKRRTRERQVSPMPEPEAAREQLWSDLQPLLDAEISRLPDKYRVPIILCDLEGKTGKEAAGQLGWPEGTLFGRLSRARNMLAKRLKNRGIELSSATLTALLAQQITSAAVPASLVFSTAKAATIIAAGHATAAGIISANVASLTQGVLKAMLLTKLKTGIGLLFVTAVFGVVAAQWPSGTAAEGYQEKKGVAETKTQPPEVPPQKQAKPPIKEPLPVPDKPIPPLPAPQPFSLHPNLDAVMPSMPSPTRYVLAIKIVDVGWPGNNKVTYESEIDVPEGETHGKFLIPKQHSRINGKIGVTTGVSIDVNIRQLGSGKIVLDIRLHDDELTYGKEGMALITGSTFRVVNQVKLGEAVETDQTFLKDSKPVRRQMSVTARIDSKPQPGGPVGKYAGAPTEPPIPLPQPEIKPAKDTLTRQTPAGLKRQSFELKNRSVYSVAQLLQDFCFRHFKATMDIHITLDDPSNSFIVDAAPSDLATIEAVIRLLDEKVLPEGKPIPKATKPPPLVAEKQRNIIAVPLKNESAALVAQTVADFAKSYFKSDPSVRVTYDKDSNGVVVVIVDASLETDISRFQRLIEMLDERPPPLPAAVPPPADGKTAKETPQDPIQPGATKAYPLKNVSADYVAQMINDFGKRNPNNVVGVRASYDNNDSTFVFVQAQPVELERIERLIQMLDEKPPQPAASPSPGDGKAAKDSPKQPTKTGSKVQSFTLKHQPAGHIAKSVKDFVEKHFKNESAISIVHHNITNTVFVNATPNDMAGIESLILMLDVSPPSAWRY